MGSFLAFIPRENNSIGARILRDELAARGLSCRITPDESEAPDESNRAIEFDASPDVLYLTLMKGRIDYIEHAPAYGAKPSLSGRIENVLEELGFEFIDEDDPRWRPG